MSQRIEAWSLIKKDGRILLLKRSAGQDGVPGKYELPGGRVGHSEQPEEACRRLVKETTGLEVNVAYLADVFTYSEQDERDVQRAIIVYIVSTTGGRGDVKTSSQHSRYVWKKLDSITQEEVTGLSYLLLHAQQTRAGTTAMIDEVTIQSDVRYSEKTQSDLVIYSDGGSRGNPGPSAAGYVVKGKDDKLIYEGGAYLGITTNNQAEYHGVRLGLEKAKELGAKTVDYYIDSMLVVNQLNGQYVIRNRELWPIHERIKELISQFDKVTFRHIKREFNQQADGMVNKILDARDRGEEVKV